MGIIRTVTYECDCCRKTQEVNEGGIIVDWDKRTIATYNGSTTDQSYRIGIKGLILCKDCSPILDTMMEDVAQCLQILRNS